MQIHLLKIIDSGDIGAGDLATGPYQTGLSDEKNYYYESTHTRMTNIFNSMTKLTLKHQP